MAVAVVFIPVLVWLSLSGGIWLLGLVVLIGVLGAAELVSLARLVGGRPRRLVAMAGVAAIIIAAYATVSKTVNESTAGAVAAAALTAVAVLALTASLLGGPAGRPGRRPFLDRHATTWIVIYGGWMPAHLVLLREFPRAIGHDYDEGGRWVLFALVLTWALDTGAYAIGRWLGRHPLAPGVSPGKTIEGAIGGIVSTAGAACLLRGWFKGSMSGAEALMVGLAVAAAGILGDLVESQLKRDAGVKDASGLIPGHGGVLDRFDSLYFTAPTVYYLARMVVR